MAEAIQNLFLIGTGIISLTRKQILKQSIGIDTQKTTEIYTSGLAVEI